jgi:hypothetical protein
LVELLVVIAIIGILMALLLPAVQSARESARELQCKNNLKQMGLSCQTHMAKQGYFPSGGWGWNWIGDPDLGFGRKQNGGWLFSMLPYLEQSNLWELGRGGDTNAKRAANAQRLTTVIPGINCPSRRPAQLFKLVNLPNECNSVSECARSCYAINCGSQNRNEIDGGTGSIPAGPPTSYFTTYIETGISYRASQVERGHIIDGLSNTYLIGEKQVPPSFYINGGSPHENETALTGYNNDNYRNGSVVPLHDRSGVYHSFAWGGVHLGGIYMVMCDGSVRRINWSIDPAVHLSLSHRADNRGNAGLETEY